jgi:hypothetical protein
VWIGAESAPPTLDELARFADLGVTEYFLDWGRLEWSGQTPLLAAVPPRRAARRERATLVVSGTWPAAAIDAEAAGRALAAGLEGLRLEAERAGWLPIGLHLDLAPGDALASYGRGLAELRREMDARWYLSATVERRDLGREGLRRAIEPVDFVVAFVYGQRPGEGEVPAAWDLQAVEQLGPALEALERPYYLGAATLGSASWLDARGQPRAVTAGLGLATLVGQPRLELKRGFTLEGIDRQVYEFRARAPVTVGAWSLAAGDAVRVVRTTTANVEELERRAGAWSLTRSLGTLYWRLPGAGERLALSAASLIEALAPEPARARLELELEPVATAAELWQLRLTLTAATDEGTELAFFDNNYVELEVAGGVVVEVEAGDFARFDLYGAGERGTMRAVRAADRVRFYAPVVEGRQRLSSGLIALRPATREPTLRTSGSFLLVDGTTLTLAPRAWTLEATQR